MSLGSLKESLARLSFMPLTLAMGADPHRLVDFVSPRSRLFLTWDGPWTLQDLLSNEQWPPEMVERYKELSDDERLEVLGFTGFYTHELTHKIDFLTTPFGVHFYGCACLEFLGICRHGNRLIDELQKTPELRALRDLPRVSDEPTVDSGVAGVLARVWYFDSFRGADQRYVQRGWGDNLQPVALLGRELEKVIVHDNMLSVRLPDQPSLYLRPLAILEGRALAITCQHLYMRLGRDDYAAREIGRYVNEFYRPWDIYPDYSFLLSLFASFRGYENIQAAVEADEASWMYEALLPITVVGWYSLHAPPLMTRDSVENSSPPLRLIIALQALERAARKGKSYADGTEFMEDIDREGRREGFDLMPVEEILDYCLAYLQEVRRRNREENNRAGIRQHFDRIFEIQEQQLTRRRGSGYVSSLGMPDHGFINAFTQDFDTELLLEPYESEDEVTQWFGIRENLLFHYARPTGFWDTVRKFILAS
jgi:hypothetical protein